LRWHRGAHSEASEWNSSGRKETLYAKADLLPENHAIGRLARQRETVDRYAAVENLMADHDCFERRARMLVDVNLGVAI